MLRYNSRNRVLDEQKAYNGDKLKMRASTNNKVPHVELTHRLVIVIAVISIVISIIGLTLSIVSYLRTAKLISNEQIVRISTASNYHRVGIHMSKQHEPEATLDINGDLNVRANTTVCGCVNLADGYSICSADDLLCAKKCDATTYCPSVSPLECHEYTCTRPVSSSNEPQCLLQYVTGCTPSSAPPPTQFTPENGNVRACTPTELAENCMYPVEQCE